MSYSDDANVRRRWRDEQYKNIRIVATTTTASNCVAAIYQTDNSELQYIVTNDLPWLSLGMGSCSMRSHIVFAFRET